MADNLKRHAPLLKLMHKVSPKFRKQLLKKHCKGPFVRCISNCCLNVLKGNVPMSRGQLNKLRRRKHLLRQLASKQTPVKKKVSIIQKGGFLAALLPPIISVLGSFLGGLIGRSSDG